MKFIILFSLSISLANNLFSQALDQNQILKIIKDAYLAPLPHDEKISNHKDIYPEKPSLTVKKSVQNIQYPKRLRDTKAPIVSQQNLAKKFTSLRKKRLNLQEPTPLNSKKIFAAESKEKTTIQKNEKTKKNNKEIKEISTEELVNFLD